MEMTFLALRAKLVSYAKENFGALCVFLFLFVAGTAAGIRIVQGVDQGQVTDMLLGLPELLRGGGVPWLAFFAMSLFTNVLFAGLIYLSGLWVFTCALLIPGILLRSIFLGAAMGTAIAAWPDAVSIWLLVMLQFESAALMPPFIKMSVLAQNQITGAFQTKTNFHGKAEDIGIYTSKFLAACLQLLPSVLIQTFVTPVVFSLLH
ncbi:MAG TPA: hypothetical protein VN366_11125 [Feifaniaceae bacterium]|nr:hypothetical protein [Feifaniaceae bacterium]